MILLFGILLLLATFSTKMTNFLGIPGLVIFLGLGMLFGTGGLNVVSLDPLMAKQIATVLLIFILFEGGFSTKRSLLKVAFTPAFALATVGIIITALITGTLIHYALGLNILFSLLIGSIISSTDAAAIFLLFRNKTIDKRIAATIEIESASNDPMAIILTMFFIELIKGHMTSPTLMITNLIWQIIVGILIGILVGKLAPVIFNRIRLETGGFYYVLILGISLFSFGIAELIGGNGFLAAFFAGFLIGNAEFVYKQSISYFVEGFSTFCNVTLFLLLGSLIAPIDIVVYWKDGIIISLILMFIARPVAVFICTLLGKYNLREKLFICWGGIKGAVPIVLATYPAAANLENGSYVFKIVFFVVLTSALVQGPTLDFVAGKLNLLTNETRRSRYSMELISLEKSNTELIEVHVNNGCPLINKKLSEISIPQDTLIAAIVRNDEIVTPRGNTEIQEYDTLFVLVPNRNKEELRSLFEEYA